MMAADRDALLCDLAETYRIFDFRALPVSLLATLAVGLREESRIKMKLAGAKAPRRDVLLAAAVDRLSILVWTIMGRNGEPPSSVLDAILGVPKQNPENDVEACDTATDFEKEWKRRTGVGHGTE